MASIIDKIISALLSLVTSLLQKKADVQAQATAAADAKTATTAADLERLQEQVAAQQTAVTQHQAREDEDAKVVTASDAALINSLRE